MLDLDPDPDPEVAQGREVAEARQILSKSGVRFVREVKSKGRSFRVSALIGH